MSTKIKDSSKNKKETSKNVTKKMVAKKTVVKKKIATKPAAKIKKVVVPVKKAVAKKIVKPVKKVVLKKVAKPVKKAAPKKVVAKKINKTVTKEVAKKATKPVKKVAPKKVVAKKINKSVTKVALKKAAKPLKRAVVKTIVNKKPIVKAKPIILKVEKTIIIKEPKVKAEKPVKDKKVKAPIVKKPLVAPTTFRKTEASAPSKFIKEPAGKFEMEFVIRASEDMVFEFVSTESGLSEWFCDDVNIRDGIFTFNWDGQIQQAKLVKELPPISIRYQWLDKNDGSYFEFKTQKDELTNDISLIITDFAIDKADEISAKLLWHSQVDKLLHVLGSFF
jgi:uncharacterized protein YndB with AHSA1/START domain